MPFKNAAKKKDVKLKNKDCKANKQRVVFND